MNSLVALYLALPVPLREYAWMNFLVFFETSVSTRSLRRGESLSELRVSNQPTEWIITSHPLLLTPITSDCCFVYVSALLIVTPYIYVYAFTCINTYLCIHAAETVGANAAATARLLHSVEERAYQCHVSQSGKQSIHLISHFCSIRLKNKLFALLCWLLQQQLLTENQWERLIANKYQPVRWLPIHTHTHTFLYINMCFHVCMCLFMGRFSRKHYKILKCRSPRHPLRMGLQVVTSGATLQSIYSKS